MRILAALLGAILAGAAWAQTAPEPKKSALRTWFEHLRQGLTESSVRKRYQKGRVTAIAAVRGSQQESADPEQPTWKGAKKSKADVALKKERADFRRAVELILEGDLDQGVAALDAFEAAYPQSSMLAEARQAKAKASEFKAEMKTESAATESTKADGAKP